MGEKATCVVCFFSNCSSSIKGLVSMEKTVVVIKIISLVKVFD